MKELLPELLISENMRLFSFGQGLAEGCNNHKEMWCDICEVLSQIEKVNRRSLLLMGFLNALSKIDFETSEILLDEAVSNITLARIYPELQTSVEIGIQGSERLKKSLNLGIASIEQYLRLAYGRSSETVPNDNLIELLKIISDKPEGINVSIEILSMRFHGHPKDAPFDCGLINLGKELIEKYQFRKNDNRAEHMDYELGELIKICFAGESAKENAISLCKKLLQAFKDFIFYYDLNHIIAALAKVQPIAFLDAFVENNEDEYYARRVFINDIRANPLSYIDNSVIIKWCEENPSDRYTLIAAVIQPFEFIKEENSVRWTSLARNIIANSPDPVEVLKRLAASFRPMSWSGSRAELMRTRLCLISELKNHEDSSISDWAHQEEKSFEEEIRYEREAELREHRKRNERFEF